MNAALALMAALAATPTSDPHIELVTMGPSPLLFHRYGHAALCVVHERRPQRALCYNYGTTNFESPPQELGWKFLRGTAQFRVSIQPYRQMLWLYRRADRTIWVQRLPLGPAQVRRMVQLLEHDMLEENRDYTYHHFDDNCSTRLRDHIDRVTGGALRKGSGKTLGVTYRELGRRGIADQTHLIVASHFLLGRRLDRQVTVWGSMFHPDSLRQQVHRRLGAEPIRIHQRRGRSLPTDGGYKLAWVFLIAVLLALPMAVTRLLGRFERVGIGVTSTSLTLLASAIWFVALVTTVKELRVNEALLVFWPSDLLLVILGPRRRQRYAWVRLGWLLLVALLLLSGVLIQPLWVPLLIPALPCLLLIWPIKTLKNS
ncbi:MAG: DUF4105 domain-containing protein [bacterium]